MSRCHACDQDLENSEFKPHLLAAHGIDPDEMARQRKIWDEMEKEKAEQRKLALEAENLRIREEQARRNRELETLHSY